MDTVPGFASMKALFFIVVRGVEPNVDKVCIIHLVFPRSANFQVRSPKCQSYISVLMILNKKKATLLCIFYTGIIDFAILTFLPFKFDKAFR